MDPEIEPYLFASAAPPKPLVYVDELFVAESKDPQAFRVGEMTGHRWCHMWSDDVAALDAMARSIGMRAEWRQNKPGFVHYDLTPGKRAYAIRRGAVEKSLREFIEDRRKKENPGKPA